MGNVGSATQSLPIADVSAIATAVAAISGESVLNVKRYGAVGDGVTDDTAAINAAIAAANGSTADPSGGTIFFPYGQYMISAKITVNTKTVLRGAGRGGTIIKALPSFPTSTPMFDLGGSAIAFGTRLEDLSVDTSGITGVSGVYSNRINEQSGLHRVCVKGFDLLGVKIENTGAQQAQNFSIADLELLASATAQTTVVGLDVNLNGAACYGATRITFAVAGGGSIGGTSTAVMLDGVPGSHWSSGHVEGTVTGVLIGSRIATAGVHVAGWTGGVGMTDLVKISNAFGTHDITLSGLAKLTATNVLNDQITTTVSTTSHIAFYHLGNGSGTNIPILTSDVAITSRLSSLFVRKVLQQNFNSMGNKSADFSIDVTTANIFSFVLGASGLNITTTGTSLQGAKIVVAVIQDATGSRTINTWPAAFRFAGGVVPTLSTGANRWDVFEFFYTGSQWREIGRSLNEN